MKPGETLEAPPASAEITDAKTIIEYASGPDETKATRKVIEEYNAQSDLYHVQYQELAYDGMTRYNQLLASLSASDGEFDVIDYTAVWNAEFAEKNIYCPWTTGMFWRKTRILLQMYLKQL